MSEIPVETTVPAAPSETLKDRERGIIIQTEPINSIKYSMRNGTPTSTNAKLDL